MKLIYRVNTFAFCRLLKVQGMDRTLVDKVFAIRDYYMLDKVKNHSRHIYDIYKLIQIVPNTDEFRKLINFKIYLE